MSCEVSIPNTQSLTASGVSDVLVSAMGYLAASGNPLGAASKTIIYTIAGVSSGFGAAAGALGEDPDDQWATFGANLAGAGVGFAIGAATTTILGSAIAAGVVGSAFAFATSTAINCLFDKPLLSPLALDLNGNGIELTSLSTSPQMFDLSGDGFTVRTGWIEATDGLLALDVNSDGIINDGTELFGNATGSGYADGFAALEQYDLTVNGGNNDGVIDSNDAIYSDLLVWQDSDQNAYSEASELSSLSSLNITQIDLNDTVSSQEIEGHEISSTSTFTMNGQTKTVADVWFEHDPYNSLFIPDSNFSYATGVEDLPNLRGHGLVKDLWYAMTDDSTLKTMVDNLSSFDFQNDNFADFTSDVEDILFRWMGVDGVNPTSRGNFIDARVIEAWEALVGRAYTSANGDPEPNNSYALTGEWDKYVVEQSVKLLIGFVYQPLKDVYDTVYDEIFDDLDSGTLYENLNQSYYATRVEQEFATVETAITSHDAYEWVANLSYDFFDDEINATDGSSTSGFQRLVDSIESVEPSTSGEKQDYWQDLVPLLNAVADSVELSDNDYETALTGTYLDQITTGSLLDLRNIRVITGTAGDDTLLGGSPDDVLIGGAGNDDLNGSFGNDIFSYYLTDGNDTIHDSGGNDKLVFGTDITENDLTFTRPGTTSTTGTAKDLLIQVAGGGSIYLEQQFEVNNSWAVETVQFEDGSTVSHEELREIVLNQSITTGNDTVRGYDSEDTLTGDTGNDLLIGGSRADTYYYYSGDGHDTVVDVDGYSGDEVVFGSSINIEDITFSVSGDNLIMGIGSGSLTIQDQYRGGSYDIHNFTFDEGTLTDEELEDYIDDGTLPSWWPTTDPDVALAGTANADTLTGGSGDDTLWGNGGDDELYAYAGTDQLYGGNGNDQMNGGDGDDIVAGDLGDDIVWGDAGADTVTGGDGADTVYGGDGDDNVDGGDGSDFVTGDAGNDYVFGNGGSDQVYGHTGNDSLFGQDGDDTLKGEDDDDYVDGGAGNDGVYGDDGNDVLYGQDGSDWLDGGAGADYIHGGAGSDGLVGGAGADIFLYTSSTDGVLWQGDWIYDFAQGTDKLDLSALATGISVIGTSGFSGNSTAELRYNVVGSNHQYHLDANGDSSVDLEFITVGQIVLTTSDLLYN